MKNKTNSKLAALWCWLARMVLPSRVRYYAKDPNPFFLVDMSEPEHFDSQARYRSSDGVIHQFYVHDMYLQNVKSAHGERTTKG
jgi:hypothetical protein